MLLGAAGPLARDRAALVGPADAPPRRWVGGEQAVVAIHPWNVPVLDQGARSANAPAGGSWLVYSGHLLPDGTSLREAIPSRIAARLLERLTVAGLPALREFDGNFALVWWDGRTGRLRLVRDRFGIEPLFHAPVAGGVLFGSRVRDLRRTGRLAGGMSGQGLAEYLTFCHVAGTATLDAGVEQVPPGHAVVIEPARGVVAVERWYRLSYADPWPDDERAIAHGFRERLEAAVLRRLGAEPGGVFLSGGMDSSSVLALARRRTASPLGTFSFRCAGPDVDESAYARALAELYGLDHTEVPYGEAEALQEWTLAAELEVPGCDIGIAAGTWLLGRAAGERARWVLTGDGGDELWASHPVYAAERLLRPLERLAPSAVQRLLQGMADRIPDSDRKRDLRVTLKRMLPDPRLPRDIGPHRWRAYWAPEDFGNLLTPEALALVRDADPFAGVRASYRDYDGPDDGVSPHLYSDYTAASSFYFQRLLLTRCFGVEARSPFYDRELVEFGARIPARLKLEGIERSKRLFREAMEGVLPDLVNHRHGKLGHSVPVKQWMRDDGVLARGMDRYLAPEVIERRGLFRSDAVRRLLAEHRSRRQNHSHRLWAVMFLEAWLRARADRPAAAPAPALVRWA